MAENQSSSVDKEQDSPALSENDSTKPATQDKKPTTGGSTRAKPRIAIGSQRDVANPELAPSKPKAVQRAASTPLAFDSTSKREAEEPTDSAGTEAELEPSNSPDNQETAESLAESALEKGQPEVVEASVHVDTDGQIAPPKAEVPPDEPEQSVPDSSPVESMSDEDYEAEIERQLAGVSLDQLVEQSLPTDELERDSRVKGTVTRVEHDHVFFSLKGRHEGCAPVRQFKKLPAVGDMIDIIIKDYNEDDGLYEVAIPGAAVDATDWAALNKGDIVEARVTGANTGGLEVLVNQLRGFIPASQIERYRVESFGDYVNKKLQCLVTEINPKRKKLVLSRRSLLEREEEAKRKEMLASIQPGQVLDGLVTRLADFGAFVDVGGIEGLVHISKLSWSRVEHPKDVVEVGQRIRVRVDKANPETGKFQLSHRDTLEHPWHDVERRFAVGSVQQGTISRIAQFGAFVKLADGIEGLIHISELAHFRVYAVKNVVKEGQLVEVKVLSVDAENQKIGLSLKATQPVPESPQKPEKTETHEPIRPLAVPKRQQPLQGGKGRNTGGEQFGLNW